MHVVELTQCTAQYRYTQYSAPVYCREKSAAFRFVCYFITLKIGGTCQKLHVSHCTTVCKFNASHVFVVLLIIYMNKCFRTLVLFSVEALYQHRHSISQIVYEQTTWTSTDHCNKMRHI